MKTKHSKFIQAAIETTEKSCFRQKLAAVVVYRGQIVGRGHNFAHSTGKQYTDGQHAEITALNNTTARYRKGSTVYVTRIKGDILKMAKPCERCQTIMKKMGVKYVWYSNNESRWYRMVL